MGVLLQGFYFAPGRVSGVPSPLDGENSVPFWWDHLAAQASQLSKAGFTAVWLPPPLKGASGSFSSGYDLFDDYDLGSKNQKGTVQTRYGSRGSLQRCVAMMRANDLDVYVDLVENQRDGDDGHFNFRYVDAFGHAQGGRFEKGPGDFHPHVPEDPGVFSDQFQFGRDLAPINGMPKNHCRDGLLKAAGWLTRALDVQGYRLDNMKGVSTEFILELLNHGPLAGKFAVGEFADGNIGLIESWANAVQHRSAAFDFPLHFMLKNMCNSPGSFQMATLDHAGLAGIDPAGAVTFVENHDTDRGGIGGPIVRNKLLAYAYILTVEGYPCIFYRDYSTDKNCFGLKPKLDPLIQIHEQFAVGATQQRWKDSGIFAFERMGGDHLLVALNKDPAPRTITVATGFQPHTKLLDLTGAADVQTDSNSQVTITVPSNKDGAGYICYARRKLASLNRPSRITVQEFEGATDLDLKPAAENESIQVGSVYAASGTSIDISLTMDTSNWTDSNTVLLQITGPTGTSVGRKEFRGAGGPPKTLSVHISVTGFQTVSIMTSNLPTNSKAPAYKILVRYTAPQTLGT